MTFFVGNFVVHKKLDELGAGEIVAAEMGTLSIRFASGVRKFSEVIASAYLERTDEAPALPQPAAAKRKTAAKAASKKKTAG
jgi:nucleoid-associated protein YgaU